MNPKTKFKQPIIFQSRVIDLAALREVIFPADLEVIDDMPFVTNATNLYVYLEGASEESVEPLKEFMKSKYNIDLTRLKYGKLPRPLALDKNTGELHQIASVDYNRSGEVMSVIVRDGDKLRYIYNAIMEYRWMPADAYKTDLELMYDGWL